MQDDRLERLEAAQARGASAEAALALFEACESVPPEALFGQWRGAELSTGHPLDGLLSLYGWYGKAFYDLERVDPLLFSGPEGAPYPVDPQFLPAQVALRWPGLARTRPAQSAFRAGRPLLRARGPKARLRRIEHRGRLDAAMVYDDQPIIDIFRQAGPDVLMGVMDMRGLDQPFVFVLRRETSRDLSPSASGPDRHSAWPSAGR